MSLVVFLPVVAGVLLHLYTVASKAERPFDGFLLGLFMWSCLPYLTAALLPKLRIRQGVAQGLQLARSLATCTCTTPPSGTQGARLLPWDCCSCPSGIWCCSALWEC